MVKKEIRFAFIGTGLMAREFASAAARWMHLLDLDFYPSLVGVCGAHPESLIWFKENIPSLNYATTDYHELLEKKDIDAIYCAVPHHLHAPIYYDTITSGKHLLGEKPFGISLDANQKILAAMASHPEVFVRCSSQFAFYPGAYQIMRFIREQRFGRIMDVEAGFFHCSDLDPLKPINWKRQVQYNGEYGCMGDLGMHILFIPLRAGWMPVDVRAILSKIITQRPDATDQMVPCDTWDNACLSCRVNTGSEQFPLLINTRRIAPGEANTWFLHIHGTEFSAEYSTKYPKTLRTLTFRRGQPQSWEEQDVGYETAYPAISGKNFEFGFSDALLQMWAAFCDELLYRDQMRQPVYCLTPEETYQQHQLFSAALVSNKIGEVVRL